MSTISIITSPLPDYELIDSGNGFKLERFGPFTLVRPDPQALWKPVLTSSEWLKADGRFDHAESGGSWSLSPRIPAEWTISVGDLSLVVKPSTFKHVGIFPEHISQWTWIREAIRHANRPISVLNLFAYTGGATLSAAKEGASVCHVDSSKVAVNWAKRNAELSGLSDAPIRWIVDDVLTFLKREIKRGVKYDAVIMDPPSFGRGSKGEVWKIEEDCSTLLDLVSKLLSPKPLFVVFNGYASGYSPIAYQQVLSSTFPDATIERGELCISDTQSRILPAGITARAIFVEKS